MKIRNKALLSTAIACMPAALLAQTASTAGGPSSEEVIVTGFRQSLQKSADTKRRANAIVDVISAEDVGKFPDRNVAESLSHLPGVTVDHQFGVGEQVSIAGVEPALNRITIDGHSVASADWGGNPSDRSSRSFNYSLLSPEIISQAIVYKTPEARLQEGAIGASIDIVTRKPLDLKANTITASGGYQYNDRSKKGNAQAAALYSWHNDDDTFGILGSVNYDRENLSRAGVEVFAYANGLDFTTTDGNGQTVLKNPAATIKGGTATDVANARYAAFISRDYFQQTRQRLGFSGAMQFKPADNLTLTATGLVIRGKYNNLSNSEFSYNYRANALTSVTVQDGLLKQLSFGPTTGQDWTGELDTNYRKTKIKNDSGSLMFDWSPGEWNISGNAGYTRATGGKDPEYLLNFHTLQGFTAAADGRNTSLNWQYSPSDTSKWIGANSVYFGNQSEPAVLAKNNGQPFLGQQIGGITHSDDTLDKEKFAQLDFAHNFNFGPFTKILFGGRYVDHDNQNTTYGGATYTNKNFTLADVSTYLTPASFYSGLSASGNSTQYATLTPANVIATLNAPGTLNVTRTLDTGSYYHVNEKIAAAYLQANFETGKFRGNLGARFVRTTDDAVFYQTNYGLNGVPTSNLVEFKHSQNRFLPSFNIAYDAGDKVVIRAAAAKVIARPRYSDLAGAISIDDTTHGGGGGNPDLKPYAATNYGLSVEWYFSKTGLLSGEVFYRDISNYISNRTDERQLQSRLTGNLETYFISTPINGLKASVTGFSLTAQSDLAWGFGIQTNYTFTSAQTPTGLGLPFLSRNTFNFIPYFQSGKFQARVSYNYRSKYFYGFGRLQAANLTDKYKQLDFSTSYDITPNFVLTASASNLLDETYYQYSQTPDAPSALYKNGRVFSISMRVKF